MMERVLKLNYLKSNNQKISIALATYNGERYLKEQIDSLLLQTHANFELIVCDDKSTDSTLQILESYKEKIDIKIFINTKNLGYIKNFEKAISLCTSNYIALCDQDDVWRKDKLEVLVKNIGDFDLIHSDARLIDEHNNIIDNSYSTSTNKVFRKDVKDYFFNNDATGCTIMFKKSLVKEFLPFCENIISHDWYITLIAKSKNGVKYINETLIDYRQHQNNQVGSAKKLSSFDQRDSFQKKLLLQNIAFLETLKLKKIDTKVLKDLICYYDEYFTKNIRLKSFIIHIRYFNKFAIEKPFSLRLVALVMSLFGSKIQKQISKVRR